MVADIGSLLLGVTSDADESVEIDEDDVDVETKDGVELSRSIDEVKLATVTGVGGGGGDNIGD